MDGVPVSALGALAALAVAIVLILKKVQPTCAMIFAMRRHGFAKQRGRQDRVPRSAGRKGRGTGRGAAERVM
nr:hypothetical protein [uncultured Dysosmobacter sp.]